MPETQPLCPGAELNLRDKALGEVEKNSSIAVSINDRKSLEFQDGGLLITAYQTTDVCNVRKPTKWTMCRMWNLIKSGPNPGNATELMSVSFFSSVRPLSIFR